MCKVKALGAKNKGLCPVVEDNILSMYVSPPLLLTSMDGWELAQFQAPFDILKMGENRR